MSLIHLASTWLRGFPSFGGTYAGIALTPAATVIMWILLASKCLVSIEIYHTLRPISTPGVYLEVQRPCWPCDSSGSSTISRSPLTISIRISQRLGGWRRTTPFLFPLFPRRQLEYG